MNEINICPHCGGVANLYSNYSHKTKNYFVFVKCEICGSQGRIYNSKKEPCDENWENDACINAIDAWNMRFVE